METKLPKGSERPIRSTIGQLQQFKEGLIWRDMKEEIELWLHNAHLGLEAPQGEDETNILRGMCKAARDFLELPDVLINLAIMQAEQEEDNVED